MKDLEGRVAVVAGATRGAGRSTTNFFSVNGVSVAAMCAESHQYRPLLCQLGGGYDKTVKTPILCPYCLLPACFLLASCLLPACFLLASCLLDKSM
jgi:hypothetical protein